MNKKISRLFRPSTRLYFMLLICFAVATFLYSERNWPLAIIEFSVIFLTFIYSLISNSRQKKKLLSYIESVSHSVDTAANDTLLNYPLPMAVFNMNDGEILWSNELFLRMTGEREHFFEVHMSEVMPNFSSKWLVEGKSECPEIMQIGSQKYRVFGNLIKSERSSGGPAYLATTYWFNITEYSEIEDLYTNTRPVVTIIMLDNYDEFLKNTSEKDKSAVLAEIDNRISTWVGDCGGYLSRFDRDRYIFLFEEQYLQSFIDSKFSLLDNVREIVSPAGIPATISLGIGKGGTSFDENHKFASVAMDMALSRGGDQAVIKNQYNFEFFGGHSQEQEKRTKVKSRVMATAMGALIRDASSIYVMGHKHSDFDSVGAAVGVCCIARKFGKTANIVIDMETTAASRIISRLRELPEYEHTFISPQDAIVHADSRSLLVVVDTNRPEQVESEELLLSCNKVAVIDHHRRAATYIENVALNFHEPYASSAAELITEFLQYLVDQADIMKYEAEAILSGMVLDTKNFTMRTGGRTFDAAAYLRRAGADTADVKLMLQTDINSAMTRYAIVQQAKIYKPGIAIAAAETPANRVLAAQAADELLNIAGILTSFVIVPDENVINVCGRTIGDVNVQFILEKLGGGGNKSTAGAQIRNSTIQATLSQLLSAIDDYLVSG